MGLSPGLLCVLGDLAGESHGGEYSPIATNNAKARSIERGERKGGVGSGEGVGGEVWW